jgi:Protein of unknown function (DUF2934)
MLDIEKATRKRAYQLWIEGGCPDGHADAHWLAAQREVLSASPGEIGRVTVVETPAKASKRKLKALARSYELLSRLQAAASHAREGPEGAPQRSRQALL